MNTLLDQLIALTGRLVLAAGVPDSMLAELRRYLAAMLIQQNPGLLPVIPNANIGAEISDAAAAGAELADKLNTEGIRLRLSRQPYLAHETAADLPSQIFGPFIDDDLSLVQFSFFETARFIPVVFDLDVLFVGVHETVMLLPVGTGIDAADPRRFDIPSGTVWLKSDRLAANAPGFVALRVSRGTLLFDQVPTFVPGVSLNVPATVPWTLELEPETAPAGSLTGSDADAITVLLPTRMTLRMGLSAVIEGAIGLAGFGNDLRFDTQSGAAVVGDDAIAFAFDVGAASWSADTNRSTVFNVNAAHVPVAAAVWCLPMTVADIAQAGEAAHGGSVSLLLRGEGLTSRLPGTSGACRWLDTVLTASARWLEMKGRRASASVMADVVLWGPARSNIGFGTAQLAGLRHASRRGGADIAVLQGGRASNRWDLPRAATGQPFAFDGAADAVSLICESNGLRRIACAASLPEPDRLTVQGFALENLYLHVHPARRMAFVGSGNNAMRAREGAARLLFDVRLAQPTLPDPYAANWSVTHLDYPLAESAFSAVLRWAEDSAPAMRAQLEPQAQLAFPDQLPLDEADRLRVPFDRHIEARETRLSLIDMSSRDHQFGVALESLSDTAPQIDADNRLAVRLRNLRLLMQPQVHWEPVDVIPNPAALTPVREQVISRSQGSSSLVGACTDTVVPVLPGRVASTVINAAQGTVPSAALFSLPFGLRAFVRLERLEQKIRLSGMQSLLNCPSFGDPNDGGLSAAMQLRLIATGTGPLQQPLGEPTPTPDPNRQMPGQMLQTDNLAVNGPPTNALPNVLGATISLMANDSFARSVPLHQADLSGYGLSTFSRWRMDPTTSVDVAGVTQVRFDVTVGRTAYEVIEVRSRMLFAQCRVVRTVVMERRNSGRVERFDSGWSAVDDGEFKRYVAFDTGVVPALRNIRRIRILNQPNVDFAGPPEAPGPWKWEAVEFDADAQVEGLASGGANGLVPVFNHPGWIQVLPIQRDEPVPIDVPTQPVFEALLRAIGGPVGGPLDCTVRLGDTLPMHVASLQVDLATADAGAESRFFVAVYGALGLPRAAQWSTVRIDGATQDVSPVDARRGVPVLRRLNESHFTIIDPADALKAHPKARYGLLMTSEASRVLYPQPTVHAPLAGQPGQLLTDPPRVADPYSLAQASGAFPRPGFALQCIEAAAFAITAAGEWTQRVPEFSFKAPLPGVAGGAEWGMARGLIDNAGNVIKDGRIKLGLDTLASARPWEVSPQQPDSLALTIANFASDPLFFLDSTFSAAGDAAAGLVTPTLRFGSPLNDLIDIINTLSQFTNLPFGVEVHVTAGTGPSPSFIVRLNLKLRIPSTQGERIDIGVGKFYGLFEILGELEAALNGKTHGKLSLEFTGDVQQAILPPLLYAGGMFRFALQVSDKGPPLVELGLGTTTSLGGDLIAGLVALEVTIRYGYMLIPQTLKPGVMLGLEARAKLLGGLLGLSFSADALARIQRLNIDRDVNTVTLWCDLRVAATVQVAWFLKEEMDLHTQFEQEIPTGIFAIVAGANPWVALASQVI